MTKIRSAAILLAGLFLLAMPAAAVASDGIQVILNEDAVEFPDRPVILEGRTFVPMRNLLENLGAQVAWDDMAKQATGRFQDRVLVMQIGSATALINQVTHPVDAPARLINLGTEKAPSYRTYFPLRFVSEGLGYEVDWDDRTKTVYIRDPRAPIPQTAEELAILGRPYIPRDAMQRWFDRNIPQYSHLPGLYYEFGARYGVRADLAISQALWETAFLKYGGEVEPWQNNFCGLYAVGRPLDPTRDFLNGANPERVSIVEGVYGAVFATAADGVEAHIQHLYAYATSDPLPEGSDLVSPRYNLLGSRIRGSSPVMAYLGAYNNPNGIGWAAPGVDYGHKIVDRVFVGKLLVDMRLIPSV